MCKNEVAYLQAACLIKEWILSNYWLLILIILSIAIYTYISTRKKPVLVRLLLSYFVGIAAIAAICVIIMGIIFYFFVVHLVFG